MSNAVLQSGESVSPPLTTGELSELLHEFNETTAQLQATHEALHRQVSRLQEELAEARACLRRSESLAALGEMAAGIAHEIRNPLGSIQLYAQMLADDVQGSPAAADLCGKIRRSVEGMDAIVRDVLLFARETRVAPARVGLQVVLDTALAECAAVLGRHGAGIDVQIAPDLEVYADHRLLVQCIANLLRNSVEAMEESDVAKPQVCISGGLELLRQPDGTARRMHVLRIADRGPGIPEDIASRIFNPFFTTRAAGTGLGLAIVNRIIEAHGGELHVRNAPGGGAEAIIGLPLPPESDQFCQATTHSMEAVS